jgi:uncharacterized protein YjbI with pentapeptide repeats
MALALLSPSAEAASLSVAQVRAALAAATPDHPADFAGKSLEGLDLSGFNLSGADLRGANLHETKLLGAKLVGADLEGANLNFTWVMRADFSYANLSHTSLLALVASTGMDAEPSEAANFAHANFAGARMVARFAYDDMAGANFAGVNAAVKISNESMGMIVADFADANLAGADFTNAALNYASFRFAKLAGANFSGPKLERADFSGADLRGVNFTGAEMSHTDFTSADTAGARGLPSQGSPKAP